MTPSVAEKVAAVSAAYVLGGERACAALREGTATSTWLVEAVTGALMAGWDVLDAVVRGSGGVLLLTGAKRQETDAELRARIAQAFAPTQRYQRELVTMWATMVWRWDPNAPPGMRTTDFENTATNLAGLIMQAVDEEMARWTFKANGRDPSETP